jgi:C4-dicarboxylate-specific signal transduction histidine kinase
LSDPRDTLRRMAAESIVVPPGRWLERANRVSLVGHLLSGAIHDVNNALQVISGNAELLESPKRTDDQIAKRAGAMSGKARYASSALADVQAFARDTDESIGRVDVRAIGERALALRQYAISRARIDAALEWDNSHAFCIANARAVLQILLNLVINAEQAVAGRHDAQIRLRYSADNGCVRVAVEDNGPGIAAELQAHLFETRFDSTAALGIGLAVSQHLARTLHGCIAHEPRTSGGCTMTLSLPAAG